MGMTTVAELLKQHKTGTIGHSNGRVMIRNEIVRRYARIKGCSRCGYNESGHPLHFDHAKDTDKLFCVGPNNKIKPFKAYGQTFKSHPMFLKGDIAWQCIKDEIAKCKILCANCHALKTYENQDTVKPGDGSGSKSLIIGIINKL